jgi:hypothetical protein
MVFFMHTVNIVDYMCYIRRTCLMMFNIAKGAARNDEKGATDRTAPNFGGRPSPMHDDVSFFLFFFVILG